MAIKLNDSTLTAFTRTDKNGLFKLQQLPIDTYQVIISYPKFSDMGYFVFGDSKNLDYDFGEIILQPKNILLNEVTIFAFKDPIYYKGDTLIYTADSFKTKANATVEDLLKKLPGLKVDKDGKITSQGKAVDKVLVDGDEFFGGDATVATRNLNASSIESVQVYEKKSDDATNSATGEETQKILNLKLKEDAKKGYFGKVSGASDFKKFYEGEALANYFKNKLKVSVFCLATNTPNASFGWSDVIKYDLNNEFDQRLNDDGSSFVTFQNNEPQGIPQTFKSGFYYTDKLSKNTKLNFNYSHNSNQITAKTTTNSQYFLVDTNYTVSNVTKSFQKNQANTINIGIEHKIDSLTDFIINSKIKLLENSLTSSDETDFISSNNLITRNTAINNTSKSDGFDLSNNLKLLKKFMKKDRLLTVTYNNSFSENNLDGVLKTNHVFFSNSDDLIAVNQKKESSNHNQSHLTGATFIEPLTKKIKVEGSYDFMWYKSAQDKKALNNIGGEYTQLDTALTNNFINTKQINRAGLKFIYEIKKARFTLGTKTRNVFVNNTNVFTSQQITQNFNNILPFSTLRYKFSDNKMINVNYKTSSQNPTINQLQPVIDNTNPNFINVGNPNLLPTFTNGLSINFNSWKPISGKYFWMGLNYDYTNNDISNSITYDSIGRTLSQAINVNGNYKADAFIGTSIPLFSKKIEIGHNANISYISNKTIVNLKENITKDVRSNVTLEISLNLENFSAGVNGYFENNLSSSTLNSLSNKPYSSQGISGDVSFQLPNNFVFESEANYTINSKRSDGYNINFLVWNASINKTFLEKENFIVGLYAYDILNQNISVNRNINSNVITDTKTDIISRYFLLKAVFKFNSNKVKEEDDDDF
ncbi:MAG: TonB-dependent receptor [Bacteroidota bacterium]